MSSSSTSGRGKRGSGETSGAGGRVYDAAADEPLNTDESLATDAIDDLDRPENRAAIASTPTSSGGVAGGTFGRAIGADPLSPTHDVYDSTVTPTEAATDDEMLAARIDAAENPEVEEARAHIEETRARMSETVDAIKDKLSPQHLVEEAKDAVREATIGKAERAVGHAAEAAADAFGSAKDAAMGAAHAVAGAASAAVDKAKNVFGTAGANARDAGGSAAGAIKHTGETLVDTIRMNPIPAALIGVGLGWLLMSARREEDLGSRYATRYDMDRGGSRFDDGTMTVVNTPSATLSPTGTSSIAPEHDNGGNGVVSSAKESLHRAGEKVSDAASTVKHKVGDAAGAAQDKAGDLVEIIRANPVPAALAGIGLGWLIMNSRQGTGSGYDARYDAYREGYGEESRLHRAGEKVSDAAHAVKDKVGDAASTVKDKAGEWTGTARDKAGEWGGAAKDKASQATRATGDFIEENPLAAGAVALLIGAAIGMAVPASSKENEWLGATRDRLFDKASEAVQDVTQKAQSVARVALDTTKETVKETVERESRAQGLVPAS